MTFSHNQSKYRDGLYQIIATSSLSKLKMSSVLLLETSPTTISPSNQNKTLEFSKCHLKYAEM